MQKRRFYRLDEINDVTPITKGDLLHAVERGELALCASVDAKALGAQIQRIGQRWRTFLIIVGY